MVWTVEMKLEERRKVSKKVNGWKEGMKTGGVAVQEGKMEAGGPLWWALKGAAER